MSFQQEKNKITKYQCLPKMDKKEQKIFLAKFTLTKTRILLFKEKKIRKVIRIIAPAMLEQFWLVVLSFASVPKVHF